MSNTELEFDLDVELWNNYLEWCEGGYVVHGIDGKPIAISTRPTLSDFEVWKQSRGYYNDQIEDE